MLAVGTNLMSEKMTYKSNKINDIQWPIVIVHTPYTHISVRRLWDWCPAESHHKAT